MNIQRFLAPTAREAMAMARAAFGDDALILSNKQTEQGVEVMAASEESLAGLQEAATARPAAAPAPAAPVTPAAAAFVPPRTPNLAETSVEEDANRLAMSTLSFQDFVRERMLRKQLGDAAASTAAALPAGPAAVAAPSQAAVARAAAPVAAMPWNPAAAQRPAPLTGMPLSA
ncbi:MAG: flagellar biosynthesis protein FlhF, partial [Gammaproteobacteria bacterium]